MEVLSYFPGQKVNIFLETLDGYGVRSDGYAVPIVHRIILPDLTVTTGYPQSMTRYDIGLYYHQFILPFGAASIGNYLVDISFFNPTTGFINTQLYQIIVTAPFGNFAVVTP